MSIADFVTDRWGATLLFFYSAGILYFHPISLSRAVFFIAAATPSLLLVFLSITFNDELMEFFAGDAIRGAYSGIKEQRPDEEFYWDADGEAQDWIDELDQKAHNHLVVVLSGIGIAGTLPFVTWYFHGFPLGLIGVPAAVVACYIISYKYYCNLHQVIKSSVKIYNTDDED